MFFTFAKVRGPNYINCEIEGQKVELGIAFIVGPIPQSRFSRQPQRRGELRFRYLLRHLPWPSRTYLPLVSWHVYNRERRKMFVNIGLNYEIIWLEKKMKLFLDIWCFESFLKIPLRCNFLLFLFFYLSSYIFIFRL